MRVPSSKILMGKFYWCFFVQNVYVLLFFPPKLSSYFPFSKWEVQYWMHLILRHICIPPSPPARLSLPFMPPNRKLTPLGCTLPQKASSFATDKRRNLEFAINSDICFLFTTCILIAHFLYTSGVLLLYYMHALHTIGILFLRVLF